jgi:hypothetical protein
MSNEELNPALRQTHVLSSRHSWEKHRYSGKYSSFEISATCRKCGCFRKKLTFGYEYELKGGRTDTAPPCQPIA